MLLPKEAKLVPPLPRPEHWQAHHQELALAKSCHASDQAAPVGHLWALFLAGG
jgi:hypothetical protein